MAKKKTTPGKTTMIKIAEKVGELAGRVMNQKDQLVHMAGDAIDSVKTTVNNITAKKEPVVKKAVKKIAKKVTKKTVKPVTKKIKKAAIKKVPAVKKTIKKVVKKAAKKVSGKKK